MSTLQFPTVRIKKSGSGVKDPIFRSDIQNANEQLITAIKVLYGWPSTSMPSFIILSGFQNNGMAGIGEGYFYYEGHSSPTVIPEGIYYFPGDSGSGYPTGKYLKPIEQEIFPVLSDDGNYYNSYNFYTSEISALASGCVPYAITATFASDYGYNLRAINAANILIGKIPRARLPIYMLDIGSWNMDTTSTLTVNLNTTLGIVGAATTTDLKKIRDINALILNDAEDYTYPITHPETSGYTASGYIHARLNAGTIQAVMGRNGSGIFDNAYYSGSGNRGTIIITLNEE